MANTIYVGDKDNPTYTFTDDSIISINTVLESDIIGDTLPIDEMHACVLSEIECGGTQLATTETTGSALFKTSSGQPFYVKSRARVGALPYGTKLYYYHNDVLIGLFYVTETELLENNKMNITAQSAVGMLDKQIHKGGVYTGASLGRVLGEIFSSSGINYTVDDDIATTAMYGWLPYASARENLHQVVFACGVQTKYNSDGSIRFYASGEGSSDITEDRIYTGRKEKTIEKPNKIELYEHKFSTRDYAHAEIGVIPRVEVFNNSEDFDNPVDHAVVIFKNPCNVSMDFYYELNDGLELNEIGTNYAIVSGRGTLSCLEYQHVTNMVSLDIPGGDVDKTVSYKDMTLVTSMNSGNVLKRLRNYYKNASIVSMDFVLESEKPGDNVSFNGPRDDEKTGYIKSMSINTSGILKASCDIVTGMKSMNVGNTFSNVATIESDGTWTVPDNVDWIRLVLIGGGHIGTNGKNGSSGGKNQGGEGGAGGKGGAGGNIYSVELGVESGTVISFGIGSSGGGATTAILGSKNYTSTSGKSDANGYLEYINNIVYAAKGPDGIAGGKGNPGGTNVIYNGRTYSPGEDAGIFVCENISVYGGYGGGAAAMHNGNDGVDAFAWQESWGYSVCDGIGGNGANADNNPKNLERGTGGFGGNGGGGGGGYHGELPNPSDMEEWIIEDGWAEGRGGSGGSGSQGTSGEMGIALIYY